MRCSNPTTPLHMDVCLARLCKTYHDKSNDRRTRMAWISWSCCRLMMATYLVPASEAATCQGHSRKGSLVKRRVILRRQVCLRDCLSEDPEVGRALGTPCHDSKARGMLVAVVARCGSFRHEERSSPHPSSNPPRL